MRNPKSHILLVFLLFAVGNTTYAQSCQPFVDSLNALSYKACMAYWSEDFQTSYSLYSKLDSIEPIGSFYDLWYYYVTAEIGRHSLKSKELLFRLVAKGLDKGGPEQMFFHSIGLFKRSYWPELDSLISIEESKRCQPFIDSLAAMAEIDQAFRREPWSEENRQKMIAIDSTNTAKLETLIAQYGFPTWKLVGREGSNNAWLIAQHSHTLLPWYLTQLKQAVKENNADSYDLAYMEDRFLMYQGRPQIYGSQISWRIIEDDTIIGYYPIFDVKHVNERRLPKGLCPIEFVSRNDLGMDSAIISPNDLNYLDNYYPNVTNMYAEIAACWQKQKLKNGNEFALDNVMMYRFPRDMEVQACYLYEFDTALAVSKAKSMVLFGKRLDEDWHLPQPLMDSVVASYDELWADYERLISTDDDAMFNAITSFDTLVKVLDNGFYPRYTIDAWNGHIKALIAEKAKVLKANDYQAFFDWLFEQVKVGNYHLFDYAELYDEVYCRLFGKSYYGQKTFDKEVPLFEEEKVDERRKEIQLPSIEVWEKIRNKACPVNITF